MYYSKLKFKEKETLFTGIIKKQEADIQSKSLKLRQFIKHFR